MESDKNKRLYWGWFVSFLLLCLISFVVAQVLSPRLRSFFKLAIILSPVAIMGIYGLAKNCFPGYWYGEIIRGRLALFWNTLFILLYGITLGCIGIRS